jgi:hypothetical protein
VHPAILGRPYGVILDQAGAAAIQNPLWFLQWIPDQVRNDGVSVRLARPMRR